MPIIFEPLASTRTDAIADGGLVLLGFAHGPAITNETGVCDGVLVLTGDGLADATGAAEVVMPTIADGALYLSIDATGYVRLSAEADGGLAITGEGYGGGTATYNGYADGGLVITGEALELAPIGAYGFLVEQPAVMQSYGGYYYERMVDTLALGTLVDDLYTTLLRAALSLEATPHATWQGSRTLRDTLTLDDTLGGIYRELLSVSLALGASQTLTYTAVARMVDTLLLSGTVATTREAYAVITEAIAFGALVDGTPISTLTSSMGLADSIAIAYAAAVRLLDELALGAALVPHVTLAAILRDDMALGLVQSATREAYAVLRDRIDFVLQISIDDQQYIAWSMNTTSKAASTYTNYPFNSFAKIGTRYYGVTDTGLYRLDGDDDAGTAIDAKLRLGMSSLGSRVLKRMSSMYVGYAATGDLLLKVVVASAMDGEREAHVYRLHSQNAGSMREGRVSIGRGLKAAYWDFQIENVDGAGFELDTIEFQPLLLERRLRGNAGGPA